MERDWMGRRVCAALLLLVGLTSTRCSGPQVTVETTIDLASLVGEGHCSRGPEDREALFQLRAEWRSVLLARPGEPLQCSGLPVHDAAELRFAAGVREQAGQTVPPVLFRANVEAEEGAAPAQSWERMVSPTDGWVEGRLDLAPLAGRSVRVRLEVVAPPGVPAAALGWALPQIRSAGRASGRPAGAAHNIVLVSLDTLRVDRSGQAGSARGTMPNLDRFARSADVWADAYCPQTWTLASHMSIFTSLWPQAHRVVNDTALPSGVPTLPEQLQHAGWRTAGFVQACYFMAGWYGFERGFDLYRETMETGAQRNAAVLDWVERHAQERMFLFVHYYDAHSSGADGLPYGRNGAPLLYEPAARTSTSELAQCFPRDFLRHAYADGRALSQTDVAFLEAMYDSGVHAADDALGGLLSGLQQLGVLDDALVVVVSDHGEELYEHGGLMHEQPYDEVRRVLCLLRFPGAQQPPRVHTTATVNLDLMPTILEWAGVPLPAGLQGRSLRAPELARPRPLHTLGISPLEAAWAGRWGVVLREPGIYGSAGRAPGLELYDLAADPAERRDRAIEWPGLAEGLRTIFALRQTEDADAAARLGHARDTRTPDAEERERLEALGYAAQ